MSIFAEKFTLLTVPAHQTIIQEGTQGDSLYILEEGKLEIILQDERYQAHVVSTVHPGESVGEIALLTGATRSATVRSVAPSILWQLTRADFDQIADKYPSLRATVEAALVDRVHRVSLSYALYKSQVFDQLDISILPDLEQALELVLLKGGDQLLREGDASDALYIVISGRLRVVNRAEDGEEISIEELGSGQTAGEMGLLTGNVRSATIYAIRTTLLGRLNEAAFYRLLQKHPQAFTHFFSSNIITNLLDQTRRVERNHQQLSTIALVSIGRDVPLRALATDLARWLGAYGSALHIDDTLTDQALGQQGIAHAPSESATARRLSLWFSEQEAKHDYIIYSGQITEAQNEGEANWTAQCLQQADLILYVTWAENQPETIRLNQNTRAQRGLVLLHPPDCQVPSNTRQWLNALDVDWHHHVRPAIHEDVGRLARLLIGRGIGLVLSGGGTRGFAHIGVLRALRESNIPIDLIGGTSAGAMVGGFLVRGYDDQEIEQFALETGKRKNMIDLTLPFSSISSGKSYEKLMKKFYGDMDIEDAWLNFFCVSTDISHANAVIHQHGPMWKYIRASSGVPGILPPIPDAGRLLMDGGLTNNYPADVMRSTPGCGTVIGVDLTPNECLPDKDNFGTNLSGWRILNGKLNPFAESIKAPSLVETLHRLTGLSNAGRQQRQQKQTDLYIRLPVEQYNALNFGYIKEIIDLGYHAAQPIITDWLASGPRI